MDAFLYGATIFVVLHAFASGGAAVTGVEAISNGVPHSASPSGATPARPSSSWARPSACCSSACPFMAIQIHPVPYEDGVPTVISQIGKEVFGDSAGGHVLYALLQVGTVLILILAANTGFADFPRLASFQAGDNFMPRQLTKRGHRLVFSNGVIFLAVTASRAAPGHRRPGQPADPAVCHRRVHELHAQPGGYGHATTSASGSRAGSPASPSTASARW